MHASSAEADASANTRLLAGLRLVASHMAAAPLGDLAHAIGRDESIACRVRSEEGRVSMSDAVRLLYAVGLRVVPLSTVCVERRSYEAVLTIASAALADEQTARRLTLDER